MDLTPTLTIFYFCSNHRRFSHRHKTLWLVSNYNIDQKFLDSLRPKKRPKFFIVLLETNKQLFLVLEVNYYTLINWWISQE